MVPTFFTQKKSPLFGKIWKFSASEKWPLRVLFCFCTISMQNHWLWLRVDACGTNTLSWSKIWTFYIGTAISVCRHNPQIIHNKLVYSRVTYRHIHISVLPISQICFHVLSPKGLKAKYIIFFATYFSIFFWIWVLPHSNHWSGHQNQRENAYLGREDRITPQHVCHGQRQNQDEAELHRTAEQKRQNLWLNAEQTQVWRTHKIYYFSWQTEIGITLPNHFGFSEICASGFLLPSSSRWLSDIPWVTLLYQK